MFICVGFNSLSKAWEILTLTFQLCEDGMSFWIDFLVEEDEAVVLLLDDVVQHLGIHLQIRFLVTLNENLLYNSNDFNTCTMYMGS